MVDEIDSGLGVEAIFSGVIGARIRTFRYVVVHDKSPPVVSGGRNIYIANSNSYDVRLRRVQM